MAPDAPMSGRSECHARSVWNSVAATLAPSGPQCTHASWAATTGVSLRIEEAQSADALAQPDGIRLLHQLVAQSDVLLENFKASSADKLGLSPSRLP